MAHEIDQLPGAGGRKRFEDYPWADWLNGNVWTLEHGKDFTVATTAMRAYAYRAARLHRIRIKTVRTPGRLHIKALLEPEGKT